MPDYVPVPFKKLIVQCWNQAAEQRPTFLQIVDVLGTSRYVFDDTDQREYDDYLRKMLPTVGSTPETSRFDRPVACS
jgi:uncharacterized radical SAM superfamily Fe-S cluster-containing enzyme